MFRPVRSVSSSVVALLVLGASAAPALAAANQAPTIDPIPVQFGIAHVSLNVQALGNDADGDRLYYSADGLPSGITIDPATGMISGQPASPGDSMIVVRVSDGAAAAATAFALHVASPPSAVDAIVALNPQVNVEGDRIDLDIELLWNESRLDDPGRIDRPPVGIFSVENLPSGLRFSKKFGRIHGRIDRGAASATPYLVTITMAEGDTLFTAVLPWTVLTTR